MDMSKPRAYVEHPEFGKKMIYLEERDQYLADGWHKPGEKPVIKESLTTEVEQMPGGIEEMEVDALISKGEEMTAINEAISPIGNKYEEVKDDASDLSAWLNAKYGLETNYRQGVKKLQQIAAEYDNSLKDNRESSDQSEG